MNTYQDFLRRKIIRAKASGFAVDESALNEHLFPFQKKIVTEALKHGKYAIFADCGLGKTLMQLSWAEQVCKKTKGDVLILAPLAVAKQTQEEGRKFSIPVAIARKQEDRKKGINITNYEMLHHFDATQFTGVVLDESSIIKNFNGKLRNMIMDAFANTPYKLACTATPSPNDFVELGNHSQFLNAMPMNEMLATYFINDTGDTGTWRLKGHAEQEFWRFVGSWAVMIQKPSDIGFSDDGFALPQLRIHEHILPSENTGETLFAMPASTLGERREARKESMQKRLQKTKEVMGEMNGQILIWCDYNYEADALAELLPKAIEVRGADTSEYKEEAVLWFTGSKCLCNSSDCSAGHAISELENSEITPTYSKKPSCTCDHLSGDRVLISKASMFGYGLNLQNCHNMVFCGLSDSYEEWYQAVRRCWRFGQKHPVDVHLILSERETSILENIKRKQKDHQIMFTEMVRNISSSFSHSYSMEYAEQDVRTENYTALLGDCVERIKSIKDESVHYSIFSPPFASLFTYSNSERDFGNCKNHGEFYEHMQFLIGELLRITKLGRLLSFHCMNLPTTKTRDGFIGQVDFRGELIQLFCDAGWIYHSEVCIWKDPVLAMQRTKALGLLHKQIKKDSSMSRQGIPDFLVTMRKPGENAEPISHKPEEFPVDEWQKIASPVWMDIRQSNTLQRMSAREDKDEKHICPLQLDVIERALYLWTNPGDTVFSPFMGIGSEGHGSLRLGRKFIGIELKKSYFDQACKNLASADSLKKQTTMF